MLIIFVDAWPFAFKPKEFKVSKLKPNLGYSVNLHNEIFAGKTPDCIGFFGEFLYQGPNAKKHYLSLLDKLLPDRINGLIKIALRKLFNIRVGQLPWSDISVYRRVGTYPFLGESDSLLGGFKKYVTDSMPPRLGDRDKEAIKRLLSDLRSGSIANTDNLFISLCDLDGIGHKYGVGSKEYLERLSFLNDSIQDILREYTRVNPDGDYFILSDHGMMNVNEFVNISDWVKNIEREFDCKVFYDSLYIQIHANSSFPMEILRQVKGVHWFSQEERVKYAITNSRFGTYVGVLNAGLAFLPNKFGFKGMKAYHGYLPSTSRLENYGIAISNKNIPDSITSLAMYELLTENLN